MRSFSGILFLIIIFEMTFLSSFAQSGTQRIKELYNITGNDSLKVKAIIKIVTHEQEKDSALKYLQQAINILKNTQQSIGNGVYQEMSNILQSYNMYNEAVDFLIISSEIYNAKKMYKESAQERLSAAYINITNGLFKEAIEDLTEILDYAEKHNLAKTKERIYLMFGFAYRSFDYERALKYFTLSMNACDNDTLNNDLNYALNEIGNIYVNTGDFEKADYYHKRALKIREAMGEPVTLSYSYHDIAAQYDASGDYNEALEWFLKAAELTEKTKDSWGLAITYCSIGKVYRNKKAYASAESYLMKAVDIANRINMKPVFQSVYLEMYEFYQETKNFELALHYYKQQKYYNDSIYEEEKQNELKILESRFESLQKDKEINEQKEKISKQKSLMFFGIGFILVLIVVGLYIYKQYTQKRRLSQTLAEQNSEIESQRDEILSQRDEIASQRDQVVDQKNKIQDILGELTSSIRYAQQIQQVMLTPPDVLNENGLDNFVIFKPSEIVSGDFYWSYKHDNIILVAVADCTGHGVPGAFMSMLGITLLKEITEKEEIIRPDLVLYGLRKEIIRALQQEKEIKQRDGMDIALCTINLDTLELQFAGANNPLYIVTGCSSLVTGDANQKPDTSNQKLTEIKGDKMPIGIHERMDSFTLHSHQLYKGDCIYLFSDGIADQFGGPSGKKFKYTQLKEKFKAHSHEPMSKQKDELDVSFEKWKAGFRQVDDVTILGIKL